MMAEAAAAKSTPATIPAIAPGLSPPSSVSDVGSGEGRAAMYVKMLAAGSVNWSVGRRSM